MFVCETHHKTILRRVVLVAILADKAFTRTIVSFALSAAAVFHLEPLKVSFILHNLDERHARLASSEWLEIGEIGPSDL